MRRSRLAAALTVLPLAISALAFDQADEVCRTVDPDGVAGSADDHELCTVTGFITGTTTKAGNASYVPSSPQAVASWDETPPTTAFSAGGGSGYLSSNGGNNSGMAKAVYEGTFEGELDSIEFDLYVLFRPDVLIQPDDIKIQLEARESGSDAWTTILPLSGQFDVDAEYLGGSTQILWRQDFGLTGLRKALTWAGLGGDISRDLRVTIVPHFIDSGNWVYVHDATEVPSALTFNPENIFVPTLSAS